MEGKEKSNIRLIDMRQWKHHYGMLSTVDKYEFKEIEPEEEFEYSQMNKITTGEISNALKKSKKTYGERAGDTLSELVKYGPTILYEILA